MTFQRNKNKCAESEYTDNKRTDMQAGLRNCCFYAPMSGFLPTSAIMIRVGIEKVCTTTAESFHLIFQRKKT